MVRIAAVSPETMLERHRVQEGAPSEPRLEVRNAGPAASLMDPFPIKLRGRFYWGEVDWRSGARLVSLEARLREIEGRDDPEACEQAEAIHEEIAAVGNRCLVPVRWTIRLRWRLGLHKPLARASEADLGYVLGFFRQCRTRLAARVPSGRPRGHGSTSRTSSATSSGPSPRGRTPTATR